MKSYKIILTIPVLIGITIFTLLKYFEILKEKNAMSHNLNQVREQVMALELDKQNLAQTIRKEKELQKVLIQKSSELEHDLKVNIEKLVKLNTDFAVLQAENTVLREEKDELTLELNSISQEKENLKARLSSLAELKKTIQELSKQMRMRKVTTEVKEIARKRKIVEGNQGFLMKDGKPTSPAMVRIEVMPASISK